MRLHIPIRLRSLLNTRMHWRAMARLKKEQRKATKLSLVGKSLPPPPLIVTITRIGPRKLDGDNLQGACKYVRDQIAEHVGIDDGSPLYTWTYKQRNDGRHQYGVEVEIVSRPEIGDDPTEAAGIAARGLRTR